MPNTPHTYTYVLNNPLKYTDPSGYRPTGIFEEEARLTEGRNSGGSNWNPFAGFDPFTGKYNPYHKYSGFNSSFPDASMVGRYSRNPGPTGVHYDKTTNKLYYSYQDPITGKDNAYYTDKEGKVVSSDDGGHYEWRTKAVYYDNKYLIYTRNGVKKTTLDYDVINYKHYFEFESSSVDSWDKISSFVANVGLLAYPISQSGVLLQIRNNAKINLAKIGSRVTSGASIFTTANSFFKINRGQANITTYVDAGLGSMGIMATATTYFTGVQIPGIGEVIAVYGTAKLTWDTFYNLGVHYGPSKWYGSDDSRWFK